MDIAQESLRLHEQWQGKLETVPKMRIETREDLALAYTPGVAEPCRKIAENPSDAYKYTMKANTVAVVTDGRRCSAWAISERSRVCPSWRANACCSRSSEEWTRFLCACRARTSTRSSRRFAFCAQLRRHQLGGYFRAALLRDRETLIDELDIPVFHDDQHGTAIVVLSGVSTRFA